jgi:FKBP-type peptidyl-prolyl cis-trans isomerase
MRRRMTLTFLLATEKNKRFNRIPALLAAYTTETTTGNRPSDGDNVQTVYRGKLC